LVVQGCGKSGVQDGRRTLEILPAVLEMVLKISDKNFISHLIEKF